MLNKNAKIALWAAGTVVTVALLVVAAFFDLQISTAIADQNSVFGWFFEYLGDGVAYVFVVAAMVIFLNAIPAGKPWLWCLGVAGVFVSLLIFFLWFTNAFFADISYIWLYRVALSALATPLLVVLSDKIDKELMKKLVLFALFTLLVVGVSQIITQGFKLIWVRLRFRNMVDGLGFTPWYLPNFTKAGREAYAVAGSFQVDDAFKSFPSGHTASAAASFALIILPYIFKNKMKKGSVLTCYLVPWLTTSVVALSRIVNGAHFLSDVVVGGMSAIISAIIIKAIIIKISGRIAAKRVVAEE